MILPLFGLLAQAGPIKHGGNAQTAVQLHQLIVKFSENHLTSYEIARECGELSLKQGVRRVDILNAIKMCIIDLDTDDSRAILKEALVVDAKVKDVTEDSVVHLDRTPNDVHWSHMHQLTDIDAPQAWDIFTGETAAEDTLVAVIDTGVDYAHPDLISRMWRNPQDPMDGVDNDGNGYVDDYHGVDFTSATSGDPMDVHGHGTHCAGILAAAGNNGMGVTGVAWSGVRIMALKFIDDDGEGFVSKAIMALNYAFENGAMISSNSWGGQSGSSAMHSAINTVSEGGHLLIAASGNDGYDNDAVTHFPCNIVATNLLCVGSSGADGSLSSFSNYGVTSVDLTAPGEEVYSTGSRQADGTFGYVLMSGTSMATPVVAGVAALLKAFRPDLSGNDLKSLIMSTVDILPALEGKIESAGRINAHNAIKKAENFKGEINPLPANWTLSTKMEFADSDSVLGVIDGTVSVRFASEVDAEKVRYMAFYFAREESILNEILRVNIHTNVVTQDVGSDDVVSTFAAPRRSLRSLHNVVGSAFKQRLHWMSHRRLFATNFQYHVASAIETGATHLALKIGNYIGFAEDALRIPLVDTGLQVTPQLFSVVFNDTDVRPGLFSGTLSFTGPHAERAISSYSIRAGPSQVAEVSAHGMAVPSCDAASTHCDSMQAYWRDNHTFVLSRTSYENSEFASYTFHGPGTFTFEFLNVETEYDYVKIGDRTFTGSHISSAPYTIPAGPMSVVWYSDYSSKVEGFTLLFKPENRYSVTIASFPVSSALMIYAMYQGSIALNGEHVLITDLALQLRLTFEDRDYHQGRIKGPLRIAVLYRANARSVQVYFTDTAGSEVGRSTHELSTALDAYEMDVEVPQSVRAHVVLTDANGEELPNASESIDLLDKFGRPPTALLFGSDHDMRRDHIHGSLEVTGASDDPKFVEYRAYTYNGAKEKYIGAVRPVSVTATCTGSSCSHLTTTIAGNIVVLNYVDTARANYDSYERLLVAIHGPGTLMPTYLDVEPHYDVIRVFQGNASSGTKVAEWSGNEKEVTDTDKVVVLGPGRHEIEWTSDYLNPIPYQGWRLKWEPTTNNTINVTLSNVGDIDVLVVSAYGTNEWVSEMDTGLSVHIEDWFVRSVECTETRMVCPLPARWSAVPYHIRGAEANPLCQIATVIDSTGETSNWAGFNFEKKNCNVQRLWDFARQVIIDQVVLIPSAAPTEAGAVEFFDDMSAPEILCQCESPIAANGSFVTLPESNKTAEETIILKSTNEFQPTLALFADAAYSLKFGNGETYPHQSDSFYWEIASSYELDSLAVQSCSASPSHDFSSRFAVDIIRDFCGQPHFKVEFLPVNGSTRRFSVRKFHFAYQDEMFLRCSVLRCDIKDSACGVCGGAARRLTDEEQTDAVVTLWVRGVSTDGVSMVLDNAPATDVFAVDDGEVRSRLEGAERIVQTRVHFDRPPPWLRKCEGSECAVVAHALECALARTVGIACANVVVTNIRERARRILRAHRQLEEARRLEGGVEVAFSITEPKDSAMASNLSATISDMAVGGAALNEFANALVDEIATSLPDADTSTISSSYLAVAAPVVADLPGPPLDLPTDPPTEPPPTSTDPPPVATERPKPTAPTIVRDEPVDEDDILRPTIKIICAVVAGAFVLVMSAFALKTWRRRSVRDGGIDHNHHRLDEEIWISFSPRRSLDMTAELQLGNPREIMPQPGVPTLTSSALECALRFKLEQGSLEEEGSLEEVTVEDATHDDDCCTIYTMSSQCPFSPTHSMAANMLSDVPTGNLDPWSPRPHFDLTMIKDWNWEDAPEESNT